MKIIVDEIPEKPKECLFRAWNCEYGFLCQFIKARCKLYDNDDCPFLSIQEREEPCESM